MTAVEQLPWVRYYFDLVKGGHWDDKRAGPLDTVQALWMAVFYPWARYTDADARFPDNVVKNNPKAPTPRAYMDAVRSFGKLSSRYSGVA